jgi:hypothetical protein
VSGGTVAVLVGQETFYVHHNVLVSSSKFFQNAMKPVWRTEPLKPIDLSDVDPATFKVYSQWLYTKQMTGEFIHPLLAKLYVLGERIMDETFQKNVVLAMARQQYVSTSPVEYSNNLCGHSRWVGCEASHG